MFTDIFKSFQDRFCSFFIRFRCNQNGATAIEYTLMAAAIALVIIVIVFSIGGSVGDLFTSVSDEFIARS